MNLGTTTVQLWNYGSVYEYLTSPTSGLYTNAVYNDPRLYGIKVGIKL